MLSRTQAVSHAIVMLVQDAVVHIWWYDHEGAIQTTGLNIVTDLPRFLALLFALQRFELEDWGFIPALDPYGEAMVTLDKRPAEFLPFEIIYDGGVKVQVDAKDCVYRTLGLKGRGTRVSGSSSTSQGPDNRQLEGMPLVTKFSWADCTRTTEGTLIQRAIDRAKDDKRVTDHMPYVVGEKVYAEYTTEGIRKALNIVPRTRRVQENGVEKERVVYRELRVITSERLKPIYRLYGKDFISAWFQCKEVHYRNWLNDIHHKDPSATNLMYRLRPDESIEAVLNDWDLGIDARELQTHLGFEVTGTIPFMAIDLLSPEAMRGEVRHLYRHNLEAMIWVFVWIMCCYNAGRSRPVPEEVAEWTKQDPKAARGGKRSFRNNFSRTVAAPSWAVEYPLANRLVNEIHRRLNEREEAVNFANLFEGIQPEETDEAEKVWKEHWALVRDLCTHKALPQLGYIVDLKLIPSD